MDIVERDYCYVVLTSLLCSADGKFNVSFASNLVINNNGDINWIPPSIYISACTMDVTYFPFDQQVQNTATAWFILA